MHIPFDLGAKIVAIYALFLGVKFRSGILLRVKDLTFRNSAMMIMTTMMIMMTIIMMMITRLDHMEGENVSTAQHKRLELKIRELESKLELEKTTKQRQDTQVTRQKEVKISILYLGVFGI